MTKRATYLDFTDTVDEAYDLMDHFLSQLEYDQVVHEASIVWIHGHWRVGVLFGPQQHELDFD